MQSKLNLRPFPATLTFKPQYQAQDWELPDPVSVYRRNHPYDNHAFTLLKVIPRGNRYEVCHVTPDGFEIEYFPQQFRTLKQAAWFAEAQSTQSPGGRLWTTVVDGQVMRMDIVWEPHNDQARLGLVDCLSN